MTRCRWWAVAAGLALSACGGPAEPQQVSLEQLAGDQERYLNQEIVTSGVVVRQRDSRRRSYYVLTDSAGNMVAVIPKRDAAPYRGRRVTVTGVFELDLKTGRVLRFQRIRPAEP